MRGAQVDVECCGRDRHKKGVGGHAQGNWGNQPSVKIIPVLQKMVQPVSAVIVQIVELSGDLPDPDRFRNYLQGLSAKELRSRLETLQVQTSTKMNPEIGEAKHCRLIAKGGYEHRAVVFLDRR
jgi:hypothetical protein